MKIIFCVSQLLIKANEVCRWLDVPDLYFTAIKKFL